MKKRTTKFKLVPFQNPWDLAFKGRESDGIGIEIVAVSFILALWLDIGSKANMVGKMESGF